MNAKLLLKRAQHADVIGVAAIEGAIVPHQDSIYSANLRRQGLAFLQVFQNGLLVGDRDAESEDAKVGNGLQEIAKLVHQEGKIDGVYMANRESSVVQHRRERMANWIANHTVNLGLSVKQVRAIETKRFLERWCNRNKSKNKS